MSYQRYKLINGPSAEELCFHVFNRPYSLEEGARRLLKITFEVVSGDIAGEPSPETIVSLEVLRITSSIERMVRLEAVICVNPDDPATFWLMDRYGRPMSADGVCRIPVDIRYYHADERTGWCYTYQPTFDYIESWSS